MAEQLAFNQSVAGSMPTQPITVTHYFLDRKKMIDRYVEGEHKWFGDVNTSTVLHSLSMYPSPTPWYLK